MRTYEKYKDSGISWIGKVPDDWDVCKFKYTINIRNGKDYKDVQSDSNNDYPVYGSGGIFAYAQKYLYDGEALLLGRKGTIDKPIYIKKGKFWTVDTMFYGLATNGNVCKYLYYQALTFPFGRYATSTALPSMTQSDLGNNPICLPSIPEQEAIANYLDKKTAEIDKIIAEREKKIELLNELKSSIISRAVTKGINPHAKMKDSGIDWIGDIPEEWEPCRFKNFMFLITNVTTSGKKVGLENIESGTGKYIYTDSEFEGNGIAFKVNDIVYGKLRPYLRKVWRADFDGNAVGDFFVFRNKKNALSSFLKYVLLSDNFTQFANGTTYGAKMPRVASNAILDQQYFLPPLNEQEKISNSLDQKTTEIDNNISIIRKECMLYKEYKQSLISEVVTGKRKVVD